MPVSSNQPIWKQCSQGDDRKFHVTKVPQDKEAAAADQISGMDCTDEQITNFKMYRPANPSDDSQCPWVWKCKHNPARYPSVWWEAELARDPIAYPCLKAAGNGIGTCQLNTVYQPALWQHSCTKSDTPRPKFWLITLKVPVSATCQWESLIRDDACTVSLFSQILSWFSSLHFIQNISRALSKIPKQFQRYLAGAKPQKLTRSWQKRTDLFRIFLTFAALLPWYMAYVIYLGKDIYL